VSSLGLTLTTAIARLRADVSDRSAPITVIVPAGPNGVLARRALSTQGPMFRVWFETADGLLRQQLPIDVWRDKQPEPAGWLRVTLGRLLANDVDVRRALGTYATTLSRRGWRDPLVGAVQRLERDEVTAAQLRALAHAPAHVRERGELLATLLDAIDAARANENIASPAFLTEQAIAALDRREPGVGASLARGAVVVGDRELSASLHRFLSHWLAGRPVVRVVCPPFHNLADASRGMRSACPRNTPDVAVDTSALPAELQRLTSSLFVRHATGLPSSGAVTVTVTVTGSGTVRSASDDVVFARTPDDVRETAECVRVVQRAIDNGTPLDRIAIVLPDGNQRGPLEEALDRASIPTTWLVGHAARDLMPARLLRLALDIALGDDTVARVHELLSHPALDLRSQLGPEAIAGRARAAPRRRASGT
jgi:hypothetical protein